MIRVRKSTEIPLSLQSPNCSRYDGEDVREVLFNDHDGKCYLCEQKIRKSFQIEHLKAKADGYYPELRYSWSNLFLACPYCNGRKPNDFDQILVPTSVNIEDIIEQRINFGDSLVVHQSKQQTKSINHTISVLDRLFNGRSGLRDFKGQLLYEDLQREISFFMELLLKYRSDHDEINKQAIIDCLHRSKEFLGFKYWIIRDNDLLNQEFSDFIVWNKTD